MNLELSEITSISKTVLSDLGSLQTIPVEDRVKWMEDRQTTRVEDMAYCLLGILGIFLPLIYGEKGNAWTRMEQEACRKRDKQIKLEKPHSLRLLDRLDSEHLALPDTSSDTPGMDAPYRRAVVKDEIETPDYTTPFCEYPRSGSELPSSPLSKTETGLSEVDKVSSPAQLSTSGLTISGESGKGQSEIPYSHFEETAPMRLCGTNAHFHFVRELGLGSYSEVSTVMEATSGKLFAQKTIRVRPHDSRMEDAIERQVQNEVHVTQRLRHHHIASTLFYVKDVWSFSLIMLPVGDYNLLQFLEVECVGADFPKKEIKHLDNWFGCLVSALAYAHEEHVKHEDIKPSNILIKDHRPYLADFGSAKDFSKWETDMTRDQLIVGTPVYWPPESTPRARPADLFALGCVFSEMLTVRQRRSLADYRRARFVPKANLGYAFRNNLGGVEEWSRGLDGMA